MNKEILELIENRLEIGKNEYTEELDVNDGRDWHLEALEELLDGCVYLASAILKIKKKRDSN
tara:strand:- start:140 stop:325 length:186 start_codon:yes stop_codon:yes gene_type:complete